MTTFAVSECFSSYEELAKKVDTYQKEKYVQLTHRDSRTLEAASKRVENYQLLTRACGTILFTLPVFLVARNIRVKEVDSDRPRGMYRQYKYIPVYRRV